MEDKYPYKVYAPEGHLVLQSAVRHPKHIELDHLEHGYTIKLNGKRITKKEVNTCSRN
jgi:hypothetical protein